jgi:glycosyltransferase involved in cell wall biosynthesis
MPEPFLSIVIPAYNEASRIGATLEKIAKYIRPKTWAAEVIVVDDGSTDQTAQLLREAAARLPAMRVLRNDPNHGKGFSVRRGALEARGEFVLFTDADLSAPIEETDKLLAALQDSADDAAIGSRALQRELIGIRQPWFREWGGRLFNRVVRLVT